MARKHKGGLIGEMLVESGLLAPDQQKALIAEQNMRMREKLANDADRSAFDAVLSKNSALGFEAAARQAGIKDIPSIPPELQYGKIAIQKQLIAAGVPEQVAALQAIDRMEIGAKQGYSGLQPLLQNKGAKAHLDDLAQFNPAKPGFISPNPITKEAQAAANLSQMIASAKEVGGKDVANDPAVQKATKAAEGLAIIHKLELAEQYRKEGNGKAADVLEKELKGKKLPSIEEKKGFLQALKDAWASVKAFFGIKPSVEVDQKAQYQKALFSGAKEAARTLGKTHNQPSGGDFSPDDTRKHLDWTHEQASSFSNKKGETPSR